MNYGQFLNMVPEFYLVLCHSASHYCQARLRPSAAFMWLLRQ